MTRVSISTAWLGSLLFVGLVVSSPASAADGRPGGDPGSFTRALWLIQRYGTNDAVNPRNDARTKATLAKAATGKDSSAIF